MADPLSGARAKFTRVFGAGGRIHVVRAPGRVNLIGEHVDYNEGIVLPMAIEPQVLAVCRVNPDPKVRLASTAFPNELVEIQLDQPVEPARPQWANYGRGMVAKLMDAGIPLCGADILLDHTLPVGGGLSSSAAVLIAMGLSLLTIGGNRMDPARLAMLAHSAEHDFAGVPCGIMDQMVVAAARAGHAMMLDCRSLQRSFVPLDPLELRVVVANTMVHHDLSDGAYSERVASCRRAVEFFRGANPSIRALRDVTPEQVEAARGQLDETTWRRARHVVHEIARTILAAELLGKRRYEEVGELMRQSHDSLARDYQVSRQELDFLVDQARATAGVYGARLTGGGFGGCVVALVQPRAAEPLMERLRESYRAKFQIDPMVFATTAAAGASV
ncbi:MAG: galactokinase, partial [Phycisphaerae bacterium]|nr:galactokinase [Phycisphaerae bacterium]